MNAVLELLGISQKTGASLNEEAACFQKTLDSFLEADILSSQHNYLALVPF
jgi:hypothetical protein